MKLFDWKHVDNGLEPVIQIGKISTNAQRSYKGSTRNFPIMFSSLALTAKLLPKVGWAPSLPLCLLTVPSRVRLIIHLASLMTV